MTAAPMTQTDLLHELTPIVERELNRHEKAAKEWFPHDYVPWSDGRNFDGLMGGEPWSPDDADVTEAARSALIVNLLTEDNLPSYHFEIATAFGRDSAWGEWVGRWTAEEGRHGTAIRDYVTVKRLVDPTELERMRMQHMGQGYRSPQDGDMLRTVAYVSFQELATRISHRNTGVYTRDPMCEQLLQRIAADENLHMIFYRNLLAAALELAPDQTVSAIRDVVVGFQMPGADIPGFQRKAVEIAVAGIYDLRSHRDEVLVPVLRYLKLWELEGLAGAGEESRTELSAFMDDLERQATRFEDKRETLKSRMGIA